MLFVSTSSSSSSTNGSASAVLLEDGVISAGTPYPFYSLSFSSPIGPDSAEVTSRLGSPPKFEGVIFIFLSSL